MATISHSDLAPDEAVTYSLASAEPFQLEGADAKYEVTEPDEESGPLRAAYNALISNAQAHPWLTVEIPVADPDAADEPALAVDLPKTAINAGLDQKVAEYGGDSEDAVAETLAADDEQGDEPIVADDPDDGDND